MNNHVFLDGSTIYRRISKTTARKLWDEGKDIVFCPVKLAPFGSFRPSVMLNKSHAYSDFDCAVSNFEWYNCQLNETGKYAAFYVVVG